MKNQERFDAATNALYKAFFNGTLAKGTCVACACGNIVSDAVGGTIYLEYGNFESTCRNKQDIWYDMFWTSKGEQTLRITEKGSKKLEELVGYTAEEFAKIEYAFETNTTILSYNYANSTEQQILEDQYNGLVAVFNVLLELEEMQDNGYIKKLKTHPKLQLCENH